MLNITIALLAQRTFFSNAPLLSLPSSLLTRKISFDKLQFQNFLSPIFYSQSHTFNFYLSRSTFINGESPTGKVETFEKKNFDTHQNFNEYFMIVISECTFKNIRSTNPREAGGAFRAISDLHVLQSTKNQFHECYCSGQEYIGQLTSPTSAGAFVFVGAKSEIVSNCFVKCSSSGNSKTFHSFVNGEGSNIMKFCFFSKNGGDNEEKSGHSLWNLDNAVCQATAINCSQNKIPGGYAGGSVGWFCAKARLSYSIFANNTGKSIYGMCSLTDRKYTARHGFNMFIGNTATKYGILMRTSITKIDSTFFIQNTGQYFYGTAPITFTRCHCDCEKPLGIVDDDASTWNNIPQRTLKLRVPQNCNSELRASLGRPNINMKRD